MNLKNIYNQLVVESNIETTSKFFIQDLIAHISNKLNINDLKYEGQGYEGLVYVNERYAIKITKHQPSKELYERMDYKYKHSINIYNIFNLEVPQNKINKYDVLSPFDRLILSNSKTRIHTIYVILMQRVFKDESLVLAIKKIRDWSKDYGIYDPYVESDGDDDNNAIGYNNGFINMYKALFTPMKTYMNVKQVKDGKTINNYTSELVNIGKLQGISTKIIVLMPRIMDEISILYNQNLKSYNIEFNSGVASFFRIKTKSNISYRELVEFILTFNETLKLFSKSPLHYYLNVVSNSNEKLLLEFKSVLLKINSEVMTNDIHEGQFMRSKNGNIVMVDVDPTYKNEENDKKLNKNRL